MRVHVYDESSDRLSLNILARSLAVLPDMAAV